MIKNISIIGVGSIGLCIEKSGYNILRVDISSDY